MIGIGSEWTLGSQIRLSPVLPSAPSVQESKVEELVG